MEDSHNFEKPKQQKWEKEGTRWRAFILSHDPDQFAKSSKKLFVRALQSFSKECWENVLKSLHPHFSSALKFGWIFALRIRVFAR